jgi:hypothetical protein
MTRSILAVLAAVAAVVVLLGAGGCNATGVGDPCIPEQEYLPSFTGFDPKEVNVESKSFQCQTRLCLVNHFRGRVTCPYGQNPDGTPVAGTQSCTPNGNAGCCTPGVDQPVDGKDPSTGMYLNPRYDATTGFGQAAVPPQCADRTADRAVYCSCRCANVDGRTDDGANYCTCPDGFTCTQLVSAIPNIAAELTGAYCIKNNTAFDPTNSCAAACDPTLGNCGSAQGVKAH